MNKYYNIIKLTLLTSMTGAFLWVAYVSTELVEASTDTVRKLGQTADRIDRVAQVYEDQLSSERSRKALQASIEAAAAWKATAQLINITTIPNMNKTLIELQKSAAGLSDVTRSVDKLVKEQNENVTDIVSSVRGTLLSIDRTIGSVEGEIKGVGDGVRGVTLEAGRATAILGGASSEIALTAQELRGIATNLREASESAPGTAKAVERIATSSSKWQSALRIIQIVATLGVLVK